MRHITAEDLEGIPMKHFRKVPVIVEAQQIFLDYIIETLEGEMHAYAGSYIVRGIEGEIYPVKKEIFEKTYEVVEDADIIDADISESSYQKSEVIIKVEQGDNKEPIICEKCGENNIMDFDDRWKCFDCGWFVSK